VNEKWMKNADINPVAKSNTNPKLTRKMSNNTFNGRICVMRVAA